MDQNFEALSRESISQHTDQPKTIQKWKQDSYTIIQLTEIR